MTMRPYIRNSKPALLVILILLGISLQAAAADVSLAWDASTSSNIAGYKVYIGTASGVYGTPITIANQTTYTVTGLTAGKYYFAVTAFDTGGAESTYSNEVSTTIAGSVTTCDINNDASINAIDLQAMVNIILGLSTSADKYDLNRDAGVNVLDLQILNNVILGLRSCP
jgi:hypothetical protein